MTDDVQARPRTNTRAKAEAPPGMGLGTGEEGRKHIGRYEVVKTIGKGAMGVVYKARDPLLDRTVAVKTIMSPQQQGRRVRSAFLERFQRAQQVYLESREHTRERLERELESARATHR